MLPCAAISCSWDAFPRSLHRAFLAVSAQSGGSASVPHPVVVSIHPCILLLHLLSHLPMYPFIYSIIYHLSTFPTTQHLLLYLPIHSSILPIHLLLHPVTTHPCICPSTHPDHSFISSIHPSVHPSTSPPIHVSIRLSTLSTHSSHPFICPFIIHSSTIYSSTHLSFHSSDPPTINHPPPTNPFIYPPTHPLNKHALTIDGAGDTNQNAAS